MTGIGKVKWEDEDSDFDLDTDGSKDFAEMLEGAPGGSTIREGTIVKGRVVRLTDDVLTGALEAPTDPIAQDLVVIGKQDSHGGLH